MKTTKKAYLKDIRDISLDFLNGDDPDNLSITLRANVVYLGIEEKDADELYRALLNELGLAYGGYQTPSMFDPNTFEITYRDTNAGGLMDRAIRWYDEGKIAYGKKSGDEITYNLTQMSISEGDFELEELSHGEDFITLNFTEEVRAINPWQLGQNAIKLERQYKRYLQKIQDEGWQTLGDIPAPDSYEEYCRKIENGEIDLTQVD